MYYLDKLAISRDGTESYGSKTRFNPVRQSKLEPNPTLVLGSTQKRTLYICK